MTVTTGTFPLHVFLGGPAAGERPVYPTIDGALPMYITVTDPVDGDQWLAEATRSVSDPRPPEHVYKRVDLHEPRTTVYRFHRSIDSTGIRITCPKCGMTSSNPNDVADGYCTNCHDRTRLPMFAVLRAEFPLNPWETRWQERSHLVGRRMPANGDTPAWEADPTGVFERGLSGGYAEIFNARPVT